MKELTFCLCSFVFKLNYPVTQVDGEDGLLPLLQEENDHEGKGVRGNASFSLAVNVAQLQEDKHMKRMSLNPDCGVGS